MIFFSSSPPRSSQDKTLQNIYRNLCTSKIKFAFKQQNKKKISSSSPSIWNPLKKRKKETAVKQKKKCLLRPATSRKVPLPSFFFCSCVFVCVKYWLVPSPSPPLHPSAAAAAPILNCLSIDAEANGQFDLSSTHALLLFFCCLE